MQKPDPLQDLQLVAGAAALAPLPFAQHRQIAEALQRLAAAIAPAPAPAAAPVAPPAPSPAPGPAGEKQMP